MTHPRPASPLRLRLSVARAPLSIAALALAGCVTPLPESANGSQATWEISSQRPEQPVTLILNPYLGQLVTVSAVIGEDSLRLLFDTGAGQTLLTPQVLRRLGCAPIDAPSEYRMTGERVALTRCRGGALRLGSFTANHEVFGGFDLMALLPPGVPPLDGVLSLASFAGQVITLDLACRRLVVESLESASHRVRGMRAIQTRMATGQSGASLILFARVHSASLPVWLEFDSGNLSDVLLSPSAAMLLGFALEATEAPGQLSLTGLEPRPVRVSTRPLVHDGALNHAFIVQGEFTFDLATGRSWASGPKDKHSCHDRSSSSGGR